MTIGGEAVTAEPTSFKSWKDPAYETRPTDDATDDDLSHSVIVGIVLGLIILLAIIIGVLYYCCVQKKDNRKGRAVGQQQSIVELIG